MTQEHSSAGAASAQKIQAEVRPTCFYRHGERGLEQVYELVLENDGPARLGRFETGLWGEIPMGTGDREGINSLTGQSILIPHGRSSHQMVLSEATCQERAVVRLIWEDGHVTVPFLHKPARKWTVYLVNHSHTDVGFTHKPSDVARIHNKNLDRAIEYCEATAEWDEASQFRWMVETTWQVQNYLRERPDKWIVRLARQLQAGRIEIGGIYLGHYFDLLGHEELVQCIRFAGVFSQRFGVPVKTAMISDVPGSTWAMPQVLARTGIENLVCAINNFNAPFLKWTSLPRPFYWKGPDGSKVLIWYTDDPYWAYMEGVKYGFWSSISQVEKALPGKLLELEASGYPYDLLHIQVAADNAPIRFLPAMIVREWNARWAYPRLRMAVSGDFFESFRRRHDGNIETFAGDWPHSWSGVTLGYPYEAAQSRRDHEALAAAERLALTADLYSSYYEFPTDLANRAYDDLLTLDEHSGPKTLWQPKNKEEQRRALEEGYEYSARSHAQVESILKGSLEAVTESVAAQDGPAIVVWNTLSWNRSGWVRAELPADLIGEEPAGTEGFSIGLRAPDGAYIPCHVEGDRSALVFFAQDVPSLGYKRYDLVFGEAADRASAEVDAFTTAGLPNKRHPAHIPSDQSCTASTVESDYYRAVVDSAGRLVSLVDKHLGRELCDGADFGAFLRYKVEPKGPPPGGDFTAQTDLYEGVPSKGEVVEEAHQDVRVQTYVTLREVGIRVSYRLGDAYLIERQVALLRQEKAVSFSLTAHQLASVPPGETVYAVFPFRIANAQVHHELPGAVSRPGVDQLSGTWLDNYGVSHWTDVRGDGVGVILCSLDAGLVDYGRIRAGSFSRQLDVDRALVAYRLFHSKKHPKGDEQPSPWEHGKPTSFRFVLTSDGGPYDPWKAARFGWEQANPLLGQCRPKGKGEGMALPEWRLLDFAGEGVAVLSAKHTGDYCGYLLRCWEMTGAPREVRLRFPGALVVSCHETNLAGVDLRPLSIEGNSISLSFRPNEYKTLRLVLGRKD